MSRFIFRYDLDGEKISSLEHEMGMDIKRRGGERTNNSIHEQSRLEKRPSDKRQQCTGIICKHQHGYDARKNSPYSPGGNHGSSSTDLSPSLRTPTINRAIVISTLTLRQSGGSHRKTS
ncbi:uncharacterized protein LOC125568019 [Nematostella vectensis]|uniref:uncharacterized protein LOC125568019 n=1 Tax=Nematostella vectensis TaxID=45351 RepID=UPI002076DD6E|nr:uncharacterized protein LOC125568019 [Nematostella vectensis]